MPDYSKGKIYKIEGGGLTYIGSTIETLSRRLTGHRTDMKGGKKNCSSKNVLCFSDAQITLIELYPCGSVEELKMRERYFYDLIPCVNKRRPWMSEDELAASNKIAQKTYRDTNKEKDLARKKAYRDTNKEKTKVYRDANKEKAKAYMKAYYQRKKSEKTETI